LVVTPTRQMRDAFVGRGASPQRILVVMDGADEDVFQPAPQAEGVGFTLISHGTVEEHYGLDTVIEAVALLRDDLPGLRFAVYGDGSALPGLRRLADRLGVADRVTFSGGFVPVDELVTAIADADAGVVAMRRDAFRDVTLAGKMFDFIAMRRPVLRSRTARPSGAPSARPGAPVRRTAAAARSGRRTPAPGCSPRRARRRGATGGSAG